MKGRSLVRAIIHRCVTCRRFKGAPFLVPPPPLLPTSRIKEGPVFSFTGVNFAGPLMIRTEGPIRTGKAWICLLRNESSAPRHCSGHDYRDIY